MPMRKRIRAPGAGRRPSAPFLRRALYEWWSGIRYAEAIYRKSQQSRKKKDLVSSPRSVLRLKVNQLLEHLAYACLLNGSPVQSIQPDAWWFNRWEEDYG